MYKRQALQLLQRRLLGGEFPGGGKFILCAGGFVLYDGLCALQCDFNATGIEQYQGLRRSLCGCCGGAGGCFRGGRTSGAQENTSTKNENDFFQCCFTSFQTSSRITISVNRDKKARAACLVGNSRDPVSYTHLDVYKRQGVCCWRTPIFVGTKERKFMTNQEMETLLLETLRRSGSPACLLYTSYTIGRHRRFHRATPPFPWQRQG